MYIKKIGNTLVGLVLSCITAWGAGEQSNPVSMNIVESNAELSMAPAPMNITLSAIPSSPKCHGGSDGFVTIKIDPLSGTRPYHTYRYKLAAEASWSEYFKVEGSYEFSIYNLKSGIYNVWVDDTTTIPAGETSFEILDRDELSLKVSETIKNPECSGGSTSLSLVAGGGVSPYTYTLSLNGVDLSSNTNGAFTINATGSYSAKVSDGAGCTASNSDLISVTIPQPFTIGHSIQQEITCELERASVSITGVPSDADVVVTNTTTNSTTYSHTNNVYSLDAGSYEVVATRRTCDTDKSSTTFVIEKFDVVSLVVDPVDRAEVNCAGETTSITVTTTGGKSSSKVIYKLDNNNGIDSDDLTSDPYEYGIGSHTFENVAVGNYKIVWMDVNNGSCMGSKNYSVVGPSIPLSFASTPKVEDAACFGGIGSITVSVTGGVAPYNYIVNGETEFPNYSGASIVLSKSAGVYDIQVTDANGCATDVVTVMVGEPEQLTAVVDSIIKVSCPGGDNGVIYLGITGGDGNYKYTLSGDLSRPNMSGQIIDKLSAGIYDIQVTDGSGCVSGNDISGVVVSDPEPIAIELFEMDSIKCYGGTTTLSVKAGGGASTNYIFKLYSGVEVVDTKSGAGIVIFDNVKSGSYKLSVISNMSCPTLDTTFVLDARRKLTIHANSGVVDVKCPGDEGELNLSVEGESPFQYQVDFGEWVNFDSDYAAVVKNLAASTGEGQPHTIVIRDRYGCDSTITVNIRQPEDLTYSEPRINDVKCKGDSSGIITLFVSGGTPGYTATINGVGDTSTIVGSSDSVRFYVPTGVYTINIKDNAGCSMSPVKGIMVNEPETDFVLNKPMFDAIACHEDLTTLTVSANGGWGGSYRVKLTGKEYYKENQGPYDFVDINGGKYTVDAVSAYGCESSLDLDIPYPELLQVSLQNDGVKNVSCFEASDGSISFKVNGGTVDTVGGVISGYRYGLTDKGSATNEFEGNSYTVEGLTKGSYNLYIRDKNGCSSNVSEAIIITEPTQVSFTIEDIDSVVCFGESNGAITVRAAGGTGAFTYTLTYPDETKKEQTDKRVFSDLYNGTYKVAVRDANGCNAAKNNQEAVVDQPEEIEILSVDLKKGISCADSSDAEVEIVATGKEPYGLLYWIESIDGKVKPKQADNIITEVQPGMYTAFVCDSRNKCVHSLKMDTSILSPERLTVTSSNIKISNMSCHNIVDGFVELMATGGTGQKTYFLYNEANRDITNNTNGRFSELGVVDVTTTIYKYMVTDDNGCVFGKNYDKTFNIVNPDELVITEVDHHQITCNGANDGWIKVKVTGGNGGYVFYKDENDAASTPVTIPETSVYLLSNYAGGLFKPMVVDVNQCKDVMETSIEIVDPPLLQITNVIKGVKDCNYSEDDTTVIVAVGGTAPLYYSLVDTNDPSTIAEWSTENSFKNWFKGQNKGYIVPRVKDKEGCMVTADRFYQDRPEPFDVSFNAVDITCYNFDNGKLQLTMNGGTMPYYYAQDVTFSDEKRIDLDSSIHAPQLYAIEDLKDIKRVAEYNFYLRDENNCHISGVNSIEDVVFSRTWLEPEILVFSVDSFKSVQCKGGNTGKIIFGNVTGGIPTYSYFVTKEGTGDTVVSVGDRIVTGLIDGDYDCWVTDQNLCPSYLSATATVPEDVKGKVPANFDSISVAVTVFTQPTCPQSSDGVLAFDVTDFRENGFYFELSKLGDIGYYNTVYTASDKTLYSTDGKSFIESNNDDSFTGDSYWSVESADSLSKIEFQISRKMPVSTGRYYAVGVGDFEVYVEDNETGCNKLVEFEVEAISDSCKELNFKDFMTPNGDGANDTWEIKDIDQYDYFDLRIYTSYGELVYKLNRDNVDPSTDKLEWDGIDLNGHPLPSGTYIYVMRKKTEEAPENGTITIIRSR